MTRPPVLRALPVALLAVALTACGPKVQVQTSVTSQLTDILLGAPKVVVVPDQPSAPPAPSFPGIVAPPAPTVVAPPPTTPVTTVVPPECPALNGDEFPKVPAQPLSSHPPLKGAYSYRQSGSSVSDSDPAVLLPKKDTRTVVVDPPAAGASYTFTVTQTSFGGAKVATTYSLVPPAADQSVTVPGSQVTPPETVQPTGGLYVQKIVTTSASGDRVFAPVGVGVQVFQEPAAPQATWSSSAVDPSSQVSVLVQGTTVGHAVADACGEAVDAWKVTLTQTILGASENLTEKQTLLVAPQYGCLLVDETDDVTGTFDSHTITQKTHATLSHLPGTT